MEEYHVITTENGSYKTKLTAGFLKRQKYEPVDVNTIYALIPGTVTEVLVKEGDTVAKSQQLLTVDAMKMNNIITSHTAGIVKKIHITKADKVAKGDVLIELQ
ncbi:MAG: acetyl-CoA carboxylase biotin carboxyl carrier protein subunit [Bacteroidales bacterium]|nr:acetyl-CoA carboxylase biotin carboxyl carrier protein subunit [Bacteroidales bacterium]HOY38248.1 acetyl-CoA carboxylase biotin carboxyl carrier protein subunit [Bacteroidales bacterium]HQP05240.1 acetyl-CoA carboxylase biotin carboxyl carrier protein subunit [Bacteroidales bacterium]